MGAGHTGIAGGMQQQRKPDGRFKGDRWELEEFPPS